MNDSTVAQMATLQANVIQSQHDITEIKGDVKSIVQSLSTMTDNFVSRAEFNEYKSKAWYTHTLSAISGAVLAGMVGLIVYLATGGKFF